MVCFEDRMDGIIKIEQAILDEYRKAYQKKQPLDKEKIDLFVTLEKEWISTFQSPKTILEVLRKINVDNHAKITNFDFPSLLGINHDPIKDDWFVFPYENEQYIETCESWLNENTKVSSLSMILTDYSFHPILHRVASKLFLEYEKDDQAMQIFYTILAFFQRTLVFSLSELEKTPIFYHQKNFLKAMKFMISYTSIGGEEELLGQYKKDIESLKTRYQKNAGFINTVFNHVLSDLEDDLNRYDQILSVLGKSEDEILSKLYCKTYDKVQFYMLLQTLSKIDLLPESYQILLKQIMVTRKMKILEKKYDQVYD